MVRLNRWTNSSNSCSLVLHVCLDLFSAQIDTVLVNCIHLVIVCSRDKDLGVIFMPAEVLLPNCGDVRVNTGLGGGSLSPPTWGLIVTAITAASPAPTSSPTSMGGSCFRQALDVPVCVAQDKVVDVRRRLVEVILKTTSFNTVCIE